MHHLVYTCMEMEVKLHAFLNSALGGGELSGLPLLYRGSTLDETLRGP